MNNTPSSAVWESEQGQPVKPPDTATRWRKLLEDQRVSGLPVSVFCRERGIPQSSLFAWRRKLTGVGQSFKSVKVMTEPAPPRPSRRRADDDGAVHDAIELWLPGQRRLLVHRGFNRRLLLDLIEALA
jgi:hypothetical protein